MGYRKNIFRSGLTVVVLWLCAHTASAQMVVIMSAKSPTMALTENEVADIYLGHTSELPNGDPAVPIDLADDSAARAEFYKVIADKSPTQLRAYWSKLVFTGRGQPPRAVADALAVRKLVAANGNVIGYINKSELDSTVKVVLALH